MREKEREPTLDMLYPSDYDKNNVKLLEPHLLLLLSFSFSSLLLFFFLVVVAFVVVVSAAAAATVKRRIYEQFASRSRALNVRHELTRHSPQEQTQALRAGEQQEMGQQLQMISLTRWPASDSDADSKSNSDSKCDSLWPLCCAL